MPQTDDTNMMPRMQENMMPIENNVNSIVEETRNYRAMCPEIQYKLEPFIASTCHAIESTGLMPTPEELDEITDGIYDDFLLMYPDMANYMKSNEGEMPEAVPTQLGFGGRFRPGRPGRFRRRGIGRDLILALLLSRLFGRRNPYSFYPYAF